MEVELIRQYTLIVDFLGHVLGPDYEIALHELEDDSNRIIAIANGELTGRHIGSPLSNKMLEFVAGNLYETQNYVLNFESVSATGKTMCSNSMFIKGRHGELSGLLCINFDASRYEELSRRVMELCGGGVKRGVPSGTRLIADGTQRLSHVHRRRHRQHRIPGGGQLSGGGGPPDPGREDGDHGHSEPQGRVPAEGIREPCGADAAQQRGQHLPVSGQAEQQVKKGARGRPFFLSNIDRKTEMLYNI